jgi:tetratricopeptide (TPR) repeat protein
MRYKDSDLPPSVIADELGVDAIVDGSVIRSGNGIRITAQLIPADSDENVWADSFERGIEDVLVLHSEVAQQIAHEIQVTVTPQEEALLASVRQVTPEAYDAYLRGYHHLYKLSEADARAALGYFERSLEIDSTYALAYAGLADAWTVLRQMGAVAPSEAGPQTVAALNRALELDSTLAAVHFTQGLMLAWGAWDWAAAEAKFRRALDLNPNHAEANAYFAHLLHIVRRPEEAFEHSERSIELDPFNPLFTSLYGVSLAMGRRFEEAIVQLRRSQETAPNNFVNFNGLHIAYNALGNEPAAVETEIAKYEVAGDREVVEALQAGWDAGGYAEAMRRAAQVLAERSRTQFVPPSFPGRLYAYAGEVELSIDWMERGFEARDPQLPYIGATPLYDPLRGHPRFEELLRKMNLEMWLAPGAPVR